MNTFEWYTNKISIFQEKPQFEFRTEKNEPQKFGIFKQFFVTLLSSPGGWRKVHTDTETRKSLRIRKANGKFVQIDVLQQQQQILECESRAAIFSVPIEWFELILADQCLQNALFSVHEGIED